MIIIKSRVFTKWEFQNTHTFDLRGVASDNVLTMDFNPLIMCSIENKNRRFDPFLSIIIMMDRAYGTQFFSRYLIQRIEIRC
jgi:hypothetical protein